jgi:hypothetical protein
MAVWHTDKMMIMNQYNSVWAPFTVLQVSRRYLFLIHALAIDASVIVAIAAVILCYNSSKLPVPLAYTLFFTQPHRKKSEGVKSGL